MRAFKEAAGQPRYDPWERAGTLPGLGTATVAFAGYCVYEHFFLDDGHYHGEEHNH
ncbi:hypothetical protein TOPH_03110 [Tolypocladium ophioglossoides CBS 100239]|uniref:NADH dehydrogenase [ubiquinone] 1 beta subcomplex subunit 3 n=1 Tax=Tolypocladium ophioglossoides (strain CBS 100239) TaxID=1163406 RepID=A0A0L0NEI8_TOLOC|nr:hypothetical protein TOPH_03110 [Tolypocladium ophioglossoides CBS 100239]